METDRGEREAQSRTGDGGRGSGRERDPGWMKARGQQGQPR